MNDNIRHIDTWRGTHIGLTFEIVRWGISEEEPEGLWNYYIYFPERKMLNFALNWLAPVKCQLNEHCQVRWDYKYYEAPLCDGDWHGGVTFYEKYGEVEGFRTVKFGCDYCHLYDQGVNYTLEDIVSDATSTIESLSHLLVAKEATV